MKNTIKKMIKAIAGICALAAVFAMSDNTGGTALAMSVVAGVAGGKHVINEPLTVALTNVESPDLLVNEIDRRLLKIRPMATPIDQLQRRHPSDVDQSDAKRGRLFGQRRRLAFPESAAAG